MWQTKKAPSPRGLFLRQASPPALISALARVAATMRALTAPIPATTARCSRSLQLPPDKPAFFAQIGDWTYPDYAFTDGGLDEQGNNHTVYPDELKKAWRRRFTKQYPLRNLLQKVPLAHVWDDHDFAENNAWKGISGSQAVPGIRRVFTLPAALSAHAFGRHRSNPRGCLAESSPVATVSSSSLTCDRSGRRSSRRFRSLRTQGWPNTSW